MRELRRVAQSCAELRRVAQNCAELRTCICFWRPWRQRSETPGRKAEKAAWKYCTCLQLERKTIVFAFRWERRKPHSVSSFRGSVVVSTWCSQRFGVAVALCSCTASSCGVRSESRESAETARVCVAEKSHVTRDRGKEERIAVSVASNPRSRMRSASSRTRSCRLVASKPTVSSRCCSSRPGVATRTFIPRMRCASSWRSLPPMTSPADRSCCTPRVRSTSKIWRASSRVGETTSAPSPSAFDHRSRKSSSSSGTRNASVFPDPVFAAPRMSRPASACGIAARCTSVIVVHLPFASPASVRRESGSCANLRAFVYCSRGAEEVSASPSAPRSSSSGLAPGGGASSAIRAVSSAISLSSLGICQPE